MSQEKDTFGSPEDRPLDQLADAPPADAVERLKSRVQQEAINRTRPRGGESAE